MRRVLLVLILVLSIKAVHAQSFTQSTSGSIIISSVMSFSITGGATISFTSLDDYANGKIMSGYATCTLKSNVLWLVSVKANATNFTAGSGGSTNMPASILSIKRSTSSTYITMPSASATTLTTGSRTGGSPFYTTFTIDLKANPGYSYNGGTYSIGLVYTLTSQ